MSMCLMRTSQIYLPSRLRKAQVQIDERADYYLMIWPYLREKWQKFGALEIAFKAGHPLGQWRKIVQQFYGIKLTL
jgi:hypothetical protein